MMPRQPEVPNLIVAMFELCYGVPREPRQSRERIFRCSQFFQSKACFLMA